MQGKLQHKAHRLAVLIDADNVEASLIEPILKEITNYGIASVKRIYGNWTSPQPSSWKEKLYQFAIQPIQQFSYTSGKKSTDSALIIDAIDARNYGYKKLGELNRAINLFEINEIPNENNSAVKALYIKLKNNI